MAKLTKANEYGQLELNQVAFRRDGRIIAQYQLGDVEVAENGMLLAVDHARKTINFPVDGQTAGLALNYTTEHLYDERSQALKDFKLDKNTFLPRLGYIGRPDKFTTNTVCYDNATYADVDAIKAAVKAGKVYGVPCTEGECAGYIQLTADKGTGFAVEVIGVTTMPDGQVAIKFCGI